MNRFLQRSLDKIMSAFVGAGVSIDGDGRLQMPDGLCPERVHRFIELCMDERFESQRDAMHGLFLCVGVSPRAVHALNEIIDPGGAVEFGRAARHLPGLMAALPEFAQIPARFRDFLVHDLELASDTCETLEEAIASARESTAKHLDCVAEWDAILAQPDGLTELTRSWRERARAA